ncbi:MAG: hypothetical protein BWX80_01585 [Candidatus Hydrogenedentes bacterium ADurb.Bin101]|nr:MAG: hypothetical protein BWX80_01585 [Candidatus Hydrogenedentes bacterium ADurb.Bin101]
MSETVRNYSWGSSSSRRRRGPRNRGARIARFLLPVLLAALAWVFWITRDNYAMERFISRDRVYEAYINNIVARRHDVFQSNIWRLLPEGSQARSVINSVSGKLPVPEWLVNNLSAGLCHISGTSFDRSEDILVATRMTRIGCLAERIIRRFGAVTDDYSGGLKLRHIPEAGLYYAVRGRTLLFSVSRNRLIQALTLAEADALEQSEFEEGIRMAGGEDIYCRLIPDSISMASKPFDKLDLVVRFEEDSVRMLVQGDFSTDFQENYGVLLRAPSKPSLPAPFAANASIALDLGQPLAKFIEALSHVSLETGMIPQWLLNAYKPAQAGDIIISMEPLVAAVLAESGPRIRIGWFGFDHLEMVPAPLLASTFETGQEGVLMLYDGIIAPQGPKEIDLVPRVNQDMVVHVPFVGGPNLKPTLAPFSDGFILSSSFPLAAALKNTPELTGELNQNGNIYVSIKLREAVQSLANAARELTFSGLLKGFTPESLEATAAPWLTASESLSGLVLLASWSEGKLNAQVRISLHPVPQTTAPQAEQDATAIESTTP